MLVGCRGQQRTAPDCPPQQAASVSARPDAAPALPPSSRRLPAPPPANDPKVLLTSAKEPLPEVIVTPHHHAPFNDPLATADELVLSELIDGVMARNQSLQAMDATWRATVQKYPQAVSLEDPMFTSALGPASLGVPGVAPGYLAGASQKLPWFGKRTLRGQRVRAEANAAFMDVGDIRLRLIEATQTAYYEYYLAVAQMQLNADNVESVRAFRKDAEQRYEANLVTQQDVLQAEVELALLERRQVELERNRGVAIARINTLLNRSPDFPLPPPPSSLPPIEAIPPAEDLRLTAVASRPDLAAIGARWRAEESSLALAHKDYLPDLEVMGRYDAFWQEPSLRAMVGVNANVPIYHRRLNAAVREAMFRISQLRAEYRQRVDDVNREVQTVYEELRAAAQLVELYEKRIVPVARQSVDSARADYMSDRIDFLTLIQAERQLIVLLQDQEDLTASYHTLLAEMERVVGGRIPTAAPQPPPVE
jgi:outer membrane protein TolC